MYNPNIVLEMKKNFVIVDVDCDNPENCKQFVFKMGDCIGCTDDGEKVYNEYRTLFDNDLRNSTFEEFLTEKGIEYAIL
jgi:hypothetical protein